MTIEMWITLGILAAAILLFITEWLRVDTVALLVVITLILTRVLNVQEAIAGFSNPAVLTIAALFIIGGAVLQTGLAGIIGRQILVIAGRKQNRLVAVIMGTVALLSSFMSDTGTVAVLLPAIISLSRSVKQAASKLLIPLSYGALLGGAMTLIGTPPNIIVSDILADQGMQPFQFFDYTLIGILLLITGIGFMLLIGIRLLPERHTQQMPQRIDTPSELVDFYRLPENLFKLRVRRGSPLVGKTLQETNLGQNFKVTILKILRDPQPRELAKFGERKLMLGSDEQDEISPQPNIAIHADDIFIVQGHHNDINHASASLNLAIQPAESLDKETLISQEAGVAEVLLPPRSSLVGKTVVDARFGTLHQLTVLGINRPGGENPTNLKDTRLQFGDTLLVQGSWQQIHNLRKMRRDFVVMGEPESMLAATNRAKAPLALLVLMGMLVLMITNTLPVAAASMLAALLMILSGCLNIDDAYAAVDWKSLVLIAGMLPMSTALQKVGLIGIVAEGLTDTFGQMNPLILMSTLFLLTSLFTQVLSNTATTVLIAPIALAAALKLGLQPHAFMMTVAISASMAFASPVASPTNTLVMGAGDYQFSDYIKVGLPLILLTMVISVLVLPLLWPLN
ncbi:MAG: SLC13 family permease [Anaerolineales bacterium]|nr:SLC13 family permease [Chloroflexota bacterium]MBL6981185.1 SLC13 family permease [Anaerolineales bacterium]